MKRKRPILLLELLIGITLLSFCAVGLIKSPILFHRATLKHLQRAESDRIASWTFSEIKENFMSGKVKWKETPPFQQTTKAFFLEKSPLSLPSLSKRPLNRSYTLTTIGQKEVPNGTIYKLLSIKILVEENIFTYRLTVHNSPD